ncbi:MAG: dUTP diphosphatase [Pseudomonadales bacterium]
MMLTDAQAMVDTMARMQDDHNRQVHPEWRAQGYAYYRAVWVECAELLDHFGWKWWKHQQPDGDQVKLELVDIWHFGLSDLMRAGTLDDEVAQRLAAVDGAAAGGGETFRVAVEALAQQTLSDRAFALGPFVAALQSLPLPLPELFRLYVGKNVLNHFRQDNGYKTGEYRKLWQGREDNAHLVEVLEHLRCPPQDMPAEVYAALAQRYQA